MFCTKKNLESIQIIDDSKQNNIQKIIITNETILIILIKLVS